MFPSRFFADRYFAPRYFATVGAVLALAIVTFTLFLKRTTTFTQFVQRTLSKDLFVGQLFKFTLER